jgi:hypothetical protein
MYYSAKKILFAIPDGSHDTKTKKITKIFLHHRNKFSSAFSFVVLDVHVFQTKVEFVAIQLLKVHLKLKFYCNFFGPEISV